MYVSIWYQLCSDHPTEYLQFLSGLHAAKWFYVVCRWSWLVVILRTSTRFRSVLALVSKFRGSLVHAGCCVAHSPSSFTGYHRSHGLSNFRDHLVSRRAPPWISCVRSNSSCVLVTLLSGQLYLCVTRAWSTLATGRVKGSSHCFEYWDQQCCMKTVPHPALDERLDQVKALRTGVKE